MNCGVVGCESAGVVGWESDGSGCVESGTLVPVVGEVAGLMGSVTGVESACSMTAESPASADGFEKAQTPSEIPSSRKPAAKAAIALFMMMEPF